MVKKHYEILGYSENPALGDFKADHKFQAATKREAVGLVTTMLDNFDCDHIAIFKIRGGK